MTLPEFKGIFYYEYSHRVLGRGIGLVFALPFLWFLLTGRVERRRRKALLGLFLSFFFVRETKPYAQLESSLTNSSTHVDPSPTQQTESNNEPSFFKIFLLTSWKDRALFSASQAGMINNLNDGMIWGLVPIFLAGAGLNTHPEHHS